MQVNFSTVSFGNKGAEQFKKLPRIAQEKLLLKEHIRKSVAGLFGEKLPESELGNFVKRQVRFREVLQDVSININKKLKH